ncbi:aminotransferase class I/II-fold pyridoxal phosphate-dependent enzyme [Luedemannella flava]|uniref:Aminotransferase class I/II-fold pyridoxal phosphate-dependent enzyme n=1 Tax=Luedemannella flava TaxID=349316 RepID=A0ABN2MDB7_9ACTN
MLAALRSGWAAPAGPDVDAFERDLALLAGVDHAVAVSSGTAALHLALLALGVGRGQTVLVPTLTFAATANAVVYTGAEPYFVDCEPGTGNVDVDLVAEALHRLTRQGQPIGAVLPVDLFGRCADYTRLLPLCAEYGVPVLEDAAEAVGAAHRGRPAGGFGAAGVFSFNGNKIMTTTGGGALLTSDERIAARCRYLSTQARQPAVHYEHTDVGYNYRLSNVLAALGRAQVRRLDHLVGRRRELRERYVKAFASRPGVELLGADGSVDDAQANAWLNVVVVDPDLAGWRAAELGAHLARQGIESRPVWKPMHLQPVFADARRLVAGAAERLFADGLVLPGGSALDDADIARILAAVDEFLAAWG